MCLNYIYNLCFGYEDIKETIFEECIKLLRLHEPGLVVDYNIEKETILFSKMWVYWTDNLSSSFKQFIIPYNKVEADRDLLQLFYFCKIPSKYHKTFLSFIEAEYEN